LKPKSTEEKKEEKWLLISVLLASKKVNIMLLKTRIFAKTQTNWNPDYV
jgi:hypothetical protein